MLTDRQTDRRMDRQTDGHANLIVGLVTRNPPKNLVPDFVVLVVPSHDLGPPGTPLEHVALLLVLSSEQPPYVQLYYPSEAETGSGHGTSVILIETEASVDLFLPREKINCFWFIQISMNRTLFSLFYPSASRYIFIFDD